MKNSTPLMEFLLLGISNNPTTQALLFTIFSLIYLSILMGNMLVFVAIISNCSLHTPMYYFLRHLSVLDICYTSVTLPHMLVNLMSEKKTISHSGCAMQMFFYVFLGAVVCYLLAVMSYDRYLAICQPLHYMRLMTKQTCFILISGCWVTGLSISLLQTWLVFSIPFCGSYIIDHFFCDIPPLIQLHCPSSNMNYVEGMLTIFLVLITPFLLILASYILIIVAVLKIAMANGRQKALGTCSSHLLSVVLFYGTATFTYVKSSSGYIDPVDKLLSLTYTVAPAMLNPFIYSLRNKQVKDALRNILAKIRYDLNV